MELNKMVLVKSFRWWANSYTIFYVLMIAEFDLVLSGMCPSFMLVTPFFWGGQFQSSTMTVRSLKPIFQHFPTLLSAPQIYLTQKHLPFKYHVLWLIPLNPIHFFIVQKLHWSHPKKTRPERCRPHSERRVHGVDPTERIPRWWNSPSDPVGQGFMITSNWR